MSGPRTAVAATGTASLRSPFGLLLLGRTATNLGDGVRVVAAPLVAASLTDSPTTVGLVAAAASAPWLVMGIAGGVVADRYSRRRLLYRTSALQALLGFAVALALVRDGLTPLSLAVAMALLTVLQSVGGAASNALLPQLVAHDWLSRANSRLYVSDVVASQIIGLPLGGLLFGASRALPFSFDAISFVAYAVIATRLPELPPERARRNSWRADLAEGLRLVLRDPLLSRLCLLYSVWSGVAGALNALLVLYARDRLQLGAQGFAFLFTGLAAGAVVSSAFGRRVFDRFGARVALMTATATGSAGLATVALAGTAPVAWAGLALFGSGLLVFSVAAATTRQKAVDTRFLGRVGGIFRSVGWGATPVGAVLAAPVTALAGYSGLYLGTAVVLLAGLALIVTLPDRTLIDRMPSTEEESR